MKETLIARDEDGDGWMIRGPGSFIMEINLVNIRGYFLEAYIHHGDRAKWAGKRFNVARNVPPDESSFSGSTAYHQRPDAVMVGCFAFGEENKHNVNIGREAGAESVPSAYASSARRMPRLKPLHAPTDTHTRTRPTPGGLTKHAAHSVV
ncbi:hypothetical protein PAAG_11487 [Paracoccidioides lutzii Pb01]|uniref:Uncharacterized protein n=1 Tax=Paracoccidioides lutzii (strain ATCC MYA-826 / Pb01) TaxID=502779 RepID=A0A0A2V1W5_PARBA|nr:hypothetical protein PAAG_11487 [Paracoccidioides lutzii Pb01]KGQ01766.1 hypothetical protein PAAG_11487 [Paracoccidioides lutzii Pb01]